MRPKYIIPLLLVALGFNIAMGLGAWYQAANAAQAPASYLPIVATQPDNSPAKFTVLIDHDTTFVNAAVVPNTCRVIVTYIDRANGNRLHVTEHINDTLKELPPPLGLPVTFGNDAPASPSPQFEQTGPKQASGFPLFVCGRFRVYANTRLPGDLTGPFQLTVTDMPIP